MRALILLSVLVFTFADDCISTLQRGGVTNHFPWAIAHGIHSMNLDVLKEFKPDVSAENGIPVVNLNLTDPVVILAHAPKLDSFEWKTLAMRAVDQVLTHMDDPDFDFRNYTGLEKLVHAIHMQEFWASARPHYTQMVANPPSSQVCQCLLDVEHNGVMRALQVIAYKVRKGEKKMELVQSPDAKDEKPSNFAKFWKRGNGEANGKVQDNKVEFSAPWAGWEGKDNGKVQDNKVEFSAPWAGWNGKVQDNKVEFSAPWAGWEGKVDGKVQDNKVEFSAPWAGWEGKVPEKKVEFSAPWAGWEGKVPDNKVDFAAPWAGWEHEASALASADGAHAHAGENNAGPASKQMPLSDAPDFQLANHIDWVYLKRDLVRHMAMSDHVEVAMYLYCALNK